MESLLNETKWIIDSGIKNNSYTKAGCGFSMHSKFYMFTNEYIADYLQYLNLKPNSKTLTVMASGDHAFNLITAGIKNIDTFDVNLLSEFYSLGIKRSMILKYSYTEFLDIVSKIASHLMPLEEETEFIKDLLPYMEKHHQYFWDEIINYNYLAQKHNDKRLSLLGILSYGFNIIHLKDNNNYLQSEENYNKLKSLLTKVNISFKHADAFTINNNCPERYDILLLSNILDYFSKNYSEVWGIKELEEYKNKLKIILRESSTVALHYIFKYYRGFNRILIQNSNITEDVINDEIIQISSKYPNIPNAGLILSRNMI